MNGNQTYWIMEMILSIPALSKDMLTAFAGDDFRFPEAAAYYELEQEGKLKLRTYANVIIPDNPEDPKAEIAHIAEERAKYCNEYYNIIGAKVLLDGVVEAHTGWLLDDYLDKPGYHGVERFNDHDKMVELIVADVKLSIYMAEKRGFPEMIMSGDTRRNIGEAISREQSLRAMTINVARQFHQENRLGSIEYGKIANMTVFDCDFLHDDIENIVKANLIATIVDGEEVYSIDSQDQDILI